MRIIFILIIFFFTNCGTSVAPPFYAPPTENIASPHPLRIIAIDVGQGDATLIIAPNGEAMLIDAGPAANSERVMEALKREQINALAWIAVTHYHEDHVGGLGRVLNGFDNISGNSNDFNPKAFLDRGLELIPQNEIITTYLERTQNQRRALKIGDSITFGGVVLEVVTANGNDQVQSEALDENSLSLSFLISYHDFRFFLAGDITGGGGNPPFDTIDIESIISGSIGDVDVLRVAHHGSHTSTQSSFLEKITPEVAIISLGNGNDFFHPHQTVIDALLEKDIHVFQTERGWAKNEDVSIVEGDIEIQSFGEDYQVIGHPREKMPEVLYSSAESAEGKQLP
ncbi:MAG: MBL fold metallo-hydrolase [Deltaproteobacteria bacterium]|nr:MBL fold metallo-hydrolase [Deltaproteobacteria bacterium]